MKLVDRKSDFIFETSIIIKSQKAVTIIITQFSPYFIGADLYPGDFTMWIKNESNTIK